MDVPNSLRAYPCEDYFQSDLSQTGYWDEACQHWLIEPVERIAEEAENAFLQVGRPGVDSIGFGYRKEQSRIWAFHRMEGRFQFLAGTISQLLKDWEQGHILL